MYLSWKWVGELPIANESNVRIRKQSKQYFIIFKIEILTSEIERLNHVLSHKLSEYEEVKRNLNNEISSLKQTLKLKSNEADELASKMIRFEEALLDSRRSEERLK
jgi:hypothetical protein